MINVCHPVRHYLQQAVLLQERTVAMLPPAPAELTVANSIKGIDFPVITVSLCPLIVLLKSLLRFFRGVPCRKALNVSPINVNNDQSLRL
jgi:hypothetical protein